MYIFFDEYPTTLCRDAQTSCTLVIMTRFRCSRRKDHLGSEMGSERSGRKGWYPGARYETFGAVVLGASPVAYCSPSGRKTKFDQILLRRHKTDQPAGRPVHVGCYGLDK